MNDSEMQKMTGAEQIKVMEAMTQQAAGWLLGLTARTLRDHPSIPRSVDGRYNALELLKWKASRLESVELPDEDYEQILTVADQMVPDETTTGALIRVLRELKAKYGDAGPMTFAQILMNEWGDMVDRNPDHYPASYTPAPLPTMAEWRASEAEAAARTEMRITTVCERCKKIRCGRKWVKASPPAGYLTVTGGCPTCSP